MQIPVHDFRRWRKQHLYPIVLLAGCSSYCRRRVVCNFSLPADLPVSKKHYNHIFLKDECFAVKEFLLRSFSIVMLRQQNLTPRSLNGGALKISFI
jgi:hypothetical protein